VVLTLILILILILMLNLQHHPTTEAPPARPRNALYL
jgi:hypothetical protein